MRGIINYFNQMNWIGLLGLLISAAAALVCITFHELSHGYVAYRLGDPTAKRMGRLSMNPLKHLDPFGFLMMIFVGVGWAKPVPVDMRYFKHPKQGMAVTALAGPVSNFLMALASMLLASLLLHFGPMHLLPAAFVVYFLCNVAILSVGLGLFNLIPISPLDGSKVLFALLPDRWYYTILRYEKYVMIAVIALTFFGAFDGPLSACINGVMTMLCKATGFGVHNFNFYVSLPHILYY